MVLNVLTARTTITRSLVMMIMRILPRTITMTRTFAMTKAFSEGMGTRAMVKKARR